MDLHLEWGVPHRLRRSTGDGIYEVDLSHIPEVPGIYIFLRVHGNLREALYVGKANNLRARIKQQLNVVKLMRGIAGRRMRERSSSSARANVRCVTWFMAAER
jgi:hypothetical protein